MENRTKIVVAVIGAVAIILAPIIASYVAKPTVPIDAAINQEIRPDSPDHKCSLAEQFYSQGEYKKALQFYVEAADEYLHFEGQDSINRAKALNQAGWCWMALSESDGHRLLFDSLFLFRTMNKALVYSTDSLVIYRKNPEEYELDIIETYQLIGEIYAKQGKNNKALEQLMNAYRMAIEPREIDDLLAEDLYDLIELTENLYDLLWKTYMDARFQLTSFDKWFVSFDTWLTKQLAT